VSPIWPPTYDDLSRCTTVTLGNARLRFLVAHSFQLDTQPRFEDIGTRSMMNTKRKLPTAAELLAELNPDPVFQAAQAERERRRLEKVARLKAASKPLDDSLRAVCPLVTEGVWDLVNTAERYDEALPILFEHLTKEYPDEILEGIARALAVPEALPYRSTFIRLFRRDPPVSEGFRFALGLAISRTTTPDNLQETIELAKDRSLGDSRLALLFAIRRSRKPEVRRVIEELSHDPDLAKEIASWKRRK